MPSCHEAVEWSSLPLPSACLERDQTAKKHKPAFMSEDWASITEEHDVHPESNWMQRTFMQKTRTYHWVQENKDSKLLVRSLVGMRLL